MTVRIAVERSTGFVDIVVLAVEVSPLVVADPSWTMPNLIGEDDTETCP
jgi:hypothetical protein